MELLNTQKSLEFPNAAFLANFIEQCQISQMKKKGKSNIGNSSAFLFYLLL